MNEMWVKEDNRLGQLLTRCLDLNEVNLTDVLTSGN